MVETIGPQQHLRLFNLISPLPNQFLDDKNAVKIFSVISITDLEEMREKEQQMKQRYGSE